ncbi:MAG: hypothetical protein GF329_06940 [Candidatus Lokiarchaeota archaeon]|nr:hypothetical protein [Candidatus Lokiarchaeota archaeon]
MSRKIVSKKHINSLKKSGLKKGQIDIIVHNLEDVVSAGKANKEVVGIIVHNLVNDERFQANFFKDPRRAIMEANPQPSP